MNKRHRSRAQGGFTLIELIIVIVILGILAAIAIPKFFDLSGDAKDAATKGSLGNLRQAIATFRAQSAAPSGGGAPKWPTIAELTDGSTVLESDIPTNEYDTDSTKNNVVDGTGQTKGTVIGGSGGWSYNPTNGQLWANTNVASENSW